MRNIQCTRKHELEWLTNAVTWFEVSTAAKYRCVYVDPADSTQRYSDLSLHIWLKKLI